MDLLKSAYNMFPYEVLEPTSVDTQKKVYKFNSITHFLSWVEKCDTNFHRNAQFRSSIDGDYGFTQSHDMPDAFNRIRETKFTPDASDNIQTMVNKVRKRMRFSHEGYELDVPEYVAGSEKYWVEDVGGKKRSKIIDEPIFIDAGYNAGRNAETCKNLGLAILNGIYKRNLVPRKMVVAFNLNGLVHDYNFPDGRVMVFIDVSFMDIHGIAKALHPSTFRRLIFRICENYPQISSGYGHAEGYSTRHGQISIDSVYDDYAANKEKGLEPHITKLLGLTK